MLKNHFHWLTIVFRPMRNEKMPICLVIFRHVDQGKVRQLQSHWFTTVYIDQ